MPVFVALFMILITVSCSKKTYDRGSQPKMDHVLDLNNGRPDKVISELESKTNRDDDESYYLASAYTMKGGLDVGTLYPLLEMYLFNQPAYKWENLSAVKDPYKKFLSKYEGRDSLESQEKRRLVIESYEDDLRYRYDLDRKADCEKFPEFERQLEELGRISIEKMKSAKVRTFNIFIKEFWSPESKLAALQRSTLSDAKDFYSCEYSLRNFHESKFLYSLLVENYIHGDPKDTGIVSDNWESLLLEILWNTYEAIPFLQRVPDLNLAAHSSITRAIELQRGLLINPKMKLKAQNNIIYLSILSILSIYKGSFEISEVHEIRDIFCQFEPNKIYPLYGILKMRVQSLKDMMLTQSSLSEKYGAYLEKIQKILDDSPEVLTEDSLRVFQSKLRSQKFEKCILRADGARL